MGKKKKEMPSLLTKEQEKNLQDMVNSMLDIAANVEFPEASIEIAGVPPSS